jgi:hypothetical protein
MNRTLLREAAACGPRGTGLLWNLCRPSDGRVGAEWCVRHSSAARVSPETSRSSHRACWPSMAVPMRPRQMTTLLFRARDSFVRSLIRAINTPRTCTPAVQRFRAAIALGHTALRAFAARGAAARSAHALPCVVRAARTTASYERCVVVRADTGGGIANPNESTGLSHAHVRAHAPWGEVGDHQSQRAENGGG